MKTLNYESKTINVVTILVSSCFIIGVIYGLTLAGQQHHSSNIIIVTLGGLFWSVMFSGALASFFYWLLSLTSHLFTLSTHDPEYHWFLRMIVGMKKQFSYN